MIEFWLIGVRIIKARIWSCYSPSTFILAFSEGRLMLLKLHLLSFLSLIITPDLKAIWRSQFHKNSWGGETSVRLPRILLCQRHVGISPALIIWKWARESILGESLFSLSYSSFFSSSLTNLLRSLGIWTSASSYSFASRIFRRFQIDLKPRLTFISVGSFKLSP